MWADWGRGLVESGCGNNLCDGIQWLGISNRVYLFYRSNRPLKRLGSRPLDCSENGPNMSNQLVRSSVIKE